jgi:hypothetical protein
LRPRGLPFAFPPSPSDAAGPGPGSWPPAWPFAFFGRPRGLGAAGAGTLADRRLFLLDDARWQAFLDALERPAKDRPRLKRLLAEPGPLD